MIVLGDLNEDLLNPNVHGLKDVMIQTQACMTVVSSVTLSFVDCVSVFAF